MTGIVDRVVGVVCVDFDAVAWTVGVVCEGVVVISPLRDRALPCCVPPAAKIPECVSS